MYLGQFIGPPVVWQWTLISNNIGCISKRAVVEKDGIVYFCSWYGVHSFDGSYPEHINQHIQTQMYSTIISANTAPGYVMLWVDHKFNLIGVAAKAPTVMGTSYWYHPPTKRWGAAGTVAYNDVLRHPANKASNNSTFELMSGVAGKTVFCDIGGPTTANTLGNKTATTGDIGDQIANAFVSRVVPRYGTASPTTAACVHSWRNSSAESLTDKASVNATSGRDWFDLSQSAHWHRFSFTWTGLRELIDIKPIIVQDGGQ
jgi:hypothetical protein